MSKTGRYSIYDFTTGKFLKLVEPISNNPERNADWDNGIGNYPKEGSITESESIITKDKFVNIEYKKASN